MKCLTSTTVSAFNVFKLPAITGTSGAKTNAVVSSVVNNEQSAKAASIMI